MTKREILTAALHHEETPQIPYFLDLTTDLKKAFCQHVGIEKAEYGTYTGNYISKFSLIKPDVSLDGCNFQDEFGVVFDRTYDKDIGVIHKNLIPEPSPDLIRLPEIDEAYLRSGLEAYMRTAGDTFRLAKIGSTFFERAWFMCGFENMFIYLLEEPEFVRELLEQITDRCLALMKIALDYDIDGFYFGDDYGSQRGLLFSKELFSELLLPCWTKLFQLAKAHGKVTILHSCGYIRDLLPLLSQAGLTCYQTVQPELYDLNKLKTELPQLCYFGAISTQQSLPFLKPDEVDDLVRSTVNIMSVGGGYIVAPTHQIPGDVPVENIAALLDSFRHLNWDLSAHQLM